jgi:hypothetical protein
MAIIFMDGFDHYNDVASLTQKWGVLASGYAAPTFVTGRYGGNAVSLYRGGIPNGSGVYHSFTADTKMILGMAVNRYIAGGDNVQIMFYLLGSQRLMGLQFNASGTWSILNGAGSVLATSTATALNSAWNYIEYKVYFNASGTAEIRLNGISIVAYSGSTVGYGAAPNTMSIHAQYTSDTNTKIAFDDVYLCDGSGGICDNYLGDTRVEYLVLTGAGVKTQFTPSTGSNWQNVDESPASDSDYNSASTLGAMDLFGMTNLAGNGLIYGIQTNLRGKKDDAGFLRMKPAFYKASGSGDTNRFYTGSQFPVVDTISTMPIQMFGTSPDTGVAWTVDEVNALQYGYAVGDAGMFTLDAKLV